MKPLPILYAEDEEDDVFLLRRAFQSAAVSNPLVVVSDGASATDYLSGVGPYADRAAHPLPCIALLDVKLPGKSGLDVLTWIRTKPVFSFLPVIMLSSSIEDADVHRSYVGGANGYLVKPGRPDELLALVKAFREYWLVHNRTRKTESA